MLCRWRTAILLVMVPVWIGMDSGAVGAAPSESGRRPGPAKPRELSEAERAAVELAVAYLNRGPEAWWERLAAGSPLRRLGHGAALEEIVVRAGSTDGATWQLFTPGPSFDRRTAVFGVEFASGLDETLILHLIDEQGGWKIAGLRTSAEPESPFERPVLRPPSAAAPAPASSAPFVGLALLAIGLLGALTVLLQARAGRRSLAIGVGAAVLVAAAGVCLGSLWLRSRSAAPPARHPRVPANGPRLPRLGPLAPLRTALAAGIDRAEIERRLAAPPGDRGLREVQDLWRAQFLLQGHGRDVRPWSCIGARARARPPRRLDPSGREQADRSAPLPPQGLLRKLWRRPARRECSRISPSGRLPTAR